MNSTAKLILVPTPISEELPLEPVALQLLKEHCLSEAYGLLVEDHKVGRQRWLKWGLPREAIDRFVLFNEHTQEKLTPELVVDMKRGKQFFLMSDAGLPAFCDPGQGLVNACHQNKITVSATPFPNSVALALALSGFSHREFFFAGFLPANSDERKLGLDRLSQVRSTLILMDTPYRLQALLKDLAKSGLKSREVFLGTSLNAPTEKLYRGQLTSLISSVGDLNKVEFVMVVAASH